HGRQDRGGPGETARARGATADHHDPRYRVHRRARADRVRRPLHRRLAGGSGMVGTVIGASSTKLVLPATNELIWGTDAFSLFIGVLWRAGVWRRLGEALDERTRRIRSDLENAEAAKRRAESLLR